MYGTEWGMFIILILFFLMSIKHCLINFLFISISKQQYICIHQCLLSVLEGNKQDMLIESPRAERDNQAYVEGKLEFKLFRKWND